MSFDGCPIILGWICGNLKLHPCFRNTHKGYIIDMHNQNGYYIHFNRWETKNEKVKEINDHQKEEIRGS